MSDENQTGQESISNEEFMQGLVDDGLVGDNLVVNDSSIQHGDTVDKTEEVKEQPKAKSEEPIEEDSDTEDLPEVDSEDEVEGDDSPEPDDTEEESGEEEGDPNEVLFVDGEEEITQAKWEELKKGNLRQSDYTKKTQELAKERKQVEQEAQTLEYLKVQKELQPEVLRLEGLQNQIAIAEEAVHTGVETLPDGSTRKLSEEAITQTEENIKNAKRDLNYSQKQLNEKAKDYVPPKLDELKERVPDLFSDNETKRNEVLTAHRAVLEDIGYTGPEINSVNDPRQLLLIQEIVDLRKLKKSVEAEKTRGKKKETSVVSKNTPSTPKGSTRKANDKSTSTKDYSKMAKDFHEGKNNVSMEDYLGDLV